MIHCGDALQALRALPSESVQTCVTSPPYYGLRDYGHDGQIGLEPTPDEYVAKLVDVFREVRRVLRNDGTLWLNLGDSYAGSGKGGNPEDSPHRKQATNHGSLMTVGDSARQSAVTKITRRTKEIGMKPKDLIGIPWRVAFALQADGWYLRQDIIWAKPNPMPESVRDRCTKAHEYVFLMAKSERYYYNFKAMQEPATHAGKVVTLGEKSLSRGQAKGQNVAPSGNGSAASVTVKDTRNRRSVWSIASEPFGGAHFAVMPSELARLCVIAGSNPGDTVLDPFCGAGTTGLVSFLTGREFVGIEINPANVALASERIRNAAPLFHEATA